MPQGNEHVEFFGYGPHKAMLINIEAHIKEGLKPQFSNMHEDYLYPQENGSHYKTEWACVTNSFGMGLYLLAWMIFIQCITFTPENLTDAKHPYELERNLKQLYI